MSTIGGMKIATKGSGHTCPGPTPAMSLIPPTPPAGPVPSPFAYIALSSSASKTQKKMKVAGDPVLVKGSQMDVQQPGNIPSNPTGGDVVTHMVNRAVGVFTGSSKVKAGGKEVACTGDKCRMNMPMPNGMVAQTIGTLITADALRAAADPSAHAAGDLAVLDPVSVSSGTVIDENVDLALPGVIPLSWVRLYSSGRRSEHTPMGRAGWTHSYHQWVEVRGGVIELCDGDGRRVTVEDTEPGVPALHRGRRLELVRHSDRRVTVRSLDTRLVREFVGVGSDRAYLSAIVAPSGHTITFEHEDGRLLRVIDTAGRRIEVQHDGDGHITGLEVWAAPPGATEAPKEAAFRVDYTYEEGVLVGTTDALGHTERYAYDERRRLVRKTLPNELSFHYAYDDETGLCVRAWGDGGIHAGVLEYDLEAGITRLSGNEQPAVYRWREDGAIIGHSSSDGTLSFERTYDDDLLLLEAKNGAGDTVRYAYDERANQTLFVDPTGVVTEMFYADDLCVRRVHAGLTTTFGHDARGNLTEVTYPSGASLHLEYDSQGRLGAVYGPDGLRAAFVYDEHHNVVEQRRARGGVERFTYDALGRLCRYVDPVGRTLRFERNALGRPVATHYPDGSVERMEYDALGRLIREIDVRGREQLTEYAGLRSPVALGLPDGQRIELGFDTLERLVCIENPKGEACHFRYDRAGNVCEIRTFDGRIVRSRRDRAQRPARVELPDGTYRSFKYTPAGDLLEEDSPHGALTLQTSDDGLTFDYVLDDPPGPVLVRLVHDERTRVVREQQNQHWVDYEYDAQNRCVARRLSTGHVTRFSYDEESNISAVEHEGFRITYERDAAGSLVRRRFGGRFEERLVWDERGRVSRQWVGEGEHTVVDRTYRYNVGSELVGCDDLRWGSTGYRYDEQGRLVEATSGARREAFDYDLDGSLTPEGARWEILPGNVVARAGDTGYAYDACSRRVREQRSDGGVTEYQWDCRSRLRQVVLPDGSRVALTYDAWGRRIRKAILPKVTIDAEADALEAPPIHWVDYLWSGETMVAEIASDGRTRVFVYEPRGLAPLLQQEGDDLHVVITNQVGTACELLTRGGALAWAAKRSVWGEVLEEAGDGSGVKSPFALLGQYCDEELPLRYVRFRYFDPAIARFVSPDPLEVMGGLNLFAFNGSPTTHADPLGLACILIGDPRSDNFLNWIMNYRTPRPGTYEVYVHGTSTGVWSNTNGSQTPQQLVDRIRAAGEYDGSSPIVLNSCNTGRTPDGTGQQVSQAFGTTVYAPNDLVWGQGPATAPGAGPGPATPGGNIAPGVGWGDRQEYPGHGTSPTMDPSRPGQWNTFVNGQEQPGNVYRPTQTYTPPGYTGP